MKKNAVVGKRTKLLRTLLLGFMSCLALRLGYIEAFKGPVLTAMADQNYIMTRDIPAKRGTIYDRNGRVLAYTTVAYTLLADTKAMKDKQKVADELSPIIGMTSEKILSLLNAGRWVELRPGGYKVGEDTLNGVKKLGLMDDKDPNGQQIYAEPTLKRVYPNGNLGANVTGFVQQDTDDGQQGHGQAGTELEYDKLLAGTPGKETYLKDPAGDPLPYGTQTLLKPKPGKDVYLTIDSTVQGFAQRALQDAVQKYHAVGGSVIAADPQTGEILAMASLPTFDPNQYWKADPSALGSFAAIANPFEPGSTFKIATLTAAIAEHVVDIDKDTYQSGTIAVNGINIHDWNYTGWGRINFRWATIHSSNVGFVVLGQDLGKDRLYKYIDRFGFNAPTGIDLPGEGSSILFPSNDTSLLNLAETSFGQGVAVTPIQQVAAVGAVANGGKLMKPYVMQKVVDPGTNKLVQNQGPHEVRTVAPTSVMQAVTGVLQDDVAAETTHVGDVPGYTVAGKTGTANIPYPDKVGYYPDRYMTSFIGFAPAVNPKLEIYVTVDTPKDAPLQFGSVVAEPIARQIFEQALPYLKVAPDKPVDSRQTQAAAPQVTVPDFTGLNQKSASTAATSHGLQIQFLGDGDKAADQWPRAGEHALKGSIARVLMVRSDGSRETQVKMPDLTGLSMRDAVDILSLLGLNAAPVGNGYLVEQNPLPGRMVNVGSTVAVKFSPQ